MSTLAVDTITKADGSGSLSVPAESGTVVTTASPSLGRRNLIINGAMQVAQRGTSFTVDNSNTEQYTLDRYKCFNVTGGGTDFTVEQVSDAPDTFTNSLKITNSSAHTIASANYSTIGQHIEGYNMSATGMGTSAAKDITLSFWVKSSVTGTYGVTLRAGTSASANYTASYSIDSANTWEYKTITFPATSSGTWGTTNGIGGDFFWDLGVGSSFSQTAGSWNTSSNRFGLTGGTKLTETAGATWQITGVQLEVGSVATPFEHRSYGEELALCQRYFQRFGQASGGSGYPKTAVGLYASNSVVYSPVSLYQPFRASPTVTDYGGTWGVYSPPNNATVNSIGLNFASNNLVSIAINITAGTGGSAGDVAMIQWNNTASYFDLDAEL